MNQLQIAIDGPVAAGKGDIAARLSQELGLVYIYTGAMYRALALSCIQHNVPFKDGPQVVSLLEKIRIDLLVADKASALPYKVMLDDEDVTDKIFDQKVAMGTSDVGTIPEVRKIMVARQQEMAQGKSVVMEGRDIGLRVLPNAQLKIYLTASLEERAKRRWQQWQVKKVEKTYEETIEDTRERDLQDSTRATDPLQKLPDAWELDTTGLTQDEVVARIISELNKRNLL
jgi:cytidylate kinase